jgi:hypothetical protein
MAQTATSRIVNAANAFLSTLDDKQWQSVLFAFDDGEQRKRWSNFPTGFVPRAGIDFQAMTPAQRTAAMTLLSVTLSARGMEKVQQIMEGDEVAKTTEGNGPPGGLGRGAPPAGRRSLAPNPPCLPSAEKRCAHSVRKAIGAWRCSTR